jgi:hypothetical protein
MKQTMCSFLHSVQRGFERARIRSLPKQLALQGGFETARVYSLLKNSDFPSEWKGMGFSP